MTAALKSLAEKGGRDFYDGMIGYAIADDLSRGGSSISKNDLKAYRARSVEPTIIARKGKRYLFPPGSALAGSFGDMMNADDESPSPLDRLRITNLAQSFLAAYAEHRQGDLDFGEWSSHVSVIDGDGNMASLSQSLGSMFGSKVVLPTTGILANNFAMPTQYGFERGTDRSIASHYLLPVLALSGERAWLAIGVSGNRHILPTLVQIVWLLSEFGYAVEDAFHHARLGISLSGQIEIDASAPQEVKTALKQLFSRDRGSGRCEPVRTAMRCGRACGPVLRRESRDDGAHGVVGGGHGDLRAIRFGISHRGARRAPRPAAPRGRD
ncbi:MAG: hypothetical protein HC869_25700 [Rhodospirillales bacterium]|nr:hypothetical protein [Rhodospirillales bacterium]